MAVAKRQRRENPCKWNKGRSEHQSETKVKQSALLASPIYIRQAQGEGKKQTMRSQN